MRLILGVFALVVLSIGARAEPIDYFRVQGVSYDPAVVTPDEFFGFGLGEKPVRHDMMIAYLRTLARQSPRISVETIGFSHEGRPILSFVVTSPQNQNRIEDIRRAHLQRLDPAQPDAAGPLVIWLNYGVHGAESSGMDAAIPTLYHLAAAQGAAIEETLADTVVVLVAIFNPDGHSRRVNHVYTFMGATPVTDPAHMQHNLWGEARTNHYWFDLNRDWLLLTQPESQAWIRVWHRWKPNLSVDFHEMGSDATYYFHPGEPKRTHPLFPQTARELLADISREHAAWLDSEGELYTSEEGFDNFYIGKGSTYPSINGSIGILFEAAAARGGKIDTPNGVRTYAQNIRIHFNTGLTSIAGARRNAAAMRAYQRDFFSGVGDAARAFPVKAYVFSAGGDEARAEHFVRLLERHDIRVHRLSRDYSNSGKTFTAGNSFIVPLAQPQHRLIKGVFERATEFEENVFYDVSGWTMPLAYGLETEALEGLRYNDSLLGARANAGGLAKPAPARGAYGYIFDWDDYYAPRALQRFLSEDAIARVLIAPKTLRIGVGSRSFSRGAIFVPFAGQKLERDKITELATIAAREDGVDIFPVDSGDAAAGVGDLGASDSVRTLRKPNVLLLFDDGVNRYSAGQIWHLLDYRMRMPVVLRRKGSLAGLDLSPYTHIIVPAASGEVFNDQTVTRVEAWIRAGGVLIATESAARWAQGKFLAGKFTPRKESAGEAAVARYDYAERTIRDAEHVIGGAIFESDLDITHPIGFGYRGRTIATMRTTTETLAAPKDPIAEVARYAGRPLLSGYASSKRISEIASSPSIVADRLGRGAVILFADDPSFRATFLGADKLFLNAVFFGGAIEGSAAAGEVGD